MPYVRSGGAESPRLTILRNDPKFATAEMPLRDFCGISVGTLYITLPPVSTPFLHTCPNTSAYTCPHTCRHACMCTCVLHVRTQAKLRTEAGGGVSSVSSLIDALGGLSVAPLSSPVHTHADAHVNAHAYTRAHTHVHTHVHTPVDTLDYSALPHVSTLLTSTSMPIHAAKHLCACAHPSVCMSMQISTHLVTHVSIHIISIDKYCRWLIRPNACQDACQHTCQDTCQHVCHQTCQMSTGMTTHRSTHASTCIPQARPDLHKHVNTHVYS